MSSGGGPGAKFDLVGDFAIVRGLPWVFRYERTQGNGKPLDLTGASAEIVFLGLTDADGPPISHIATIEGSQGATQFALDEAGTLAIPSTYCRYRVFHTDSLGVRSLYFRGRVTVMDED